MSIGRREWLGQGQGCMVGEDPSPLSPSITGPVAGTERSLLWDKWGVPGRRQMGRGSGLLLSRHLKSPARPPAPSSPQAPLTPPCDQVTSLLLSCKYQPCICTVGPVRVKSTSMVSDLPPVPPTTP